VLTSVFHLEGHCDVYGIDEQGDYADPPQYGTGVLERYVAASGVCTRPLIVPRDVIMNEHLVEAPRRLHKTSDNTDVDRMLVTSVLLQFVSTPRRM
jgi:hypothetical protein